MDGGPTRRSPPRPGTSHPAQAPTLTARPPESHPEGDQQQAVSGEERHHHGVDHLTQWERITLVTDIDRITHLTALFDWMTPGDLKHFPLAEREAAIAWAATGD
jgi:hypothetical protein